MPYGDPDPEDPYELVGISFPGRPGDADSMREMAYTFAEEFAALGFGRDRLLELFRRPGYAGAYRAYQALGEAEIERIVDESFSLWGRFQVVVEESQHDGELVQIGGRKKQTTTSPNEND